MSLLRVLKKKKIRQPRMFDQKKKNVLRMRPLQSDNRKGKKGEGVVKWRVRV